MATMKERVLVTLTPDMAREIKTIAKYECMPKATVAALLIRRGLILARRREKKGYGDLGL